ncbi:hypothetical protein NUW54_g5627 [Trametes sanguinea]|uniref:Uncharacterized protein n=1 Tax=Trametes sanguinea TaxID=158606 RepID=A0ACC1PW83_9APHY|nr:hypothetical protein NUW54_g5627 [Trametes sanguinea]
MGSSTRYKGRTALPKTLRTLFACPALLRREMTVSTNQYTWLITGCSRGIGLGLTRKLLEDPANFIIATCRNPEKAVALEALKESAKGTLHIVKLDVDDLDGIRNSVKEVSEILGDRGLDYLVNNAAVNQKIDTAFSMDVEGWGAVFKTNVVAPALLGQVYLPLIEKSNKKTIVNVSSSLGAFGYGYGELWASYAITKTGLNMLVGFAFMIAFDRPGNHEYSGQTYKQRAERPELMVVCLCPGWVKTDLGTDDAPLDLEDSVSAVAKVLTSLKPEDNGRLVNYKHEVVPWPNHSNNVPTAKRQCTTAGEQNFQRSYSYTDAVLLHSRCSDPIIIHVAYVRISSVEAAPSISLDKQNLLLAESGQSRTSLGASDSRKSIVRNCAHVALSPPMQYVQRARAQGRNTITTKRKVQSELFVKPPILFLSREIGPDHICLPRSSVSSRHISCSDCCTRGGQRNIVASLSDGRDLRRRTNYSFSQQDAWAFMSIRMLGSRNQHIKHVFKDDMEALIYVLLYCALLYLPHGLDAIDLTSFHKEFFEDRHVAGDLELGAKGKVANAVARHMTRPIQFGSAAFKEWLDTILNYHTPNRRLLGIDTCA